MNTTWISFHNIKVVSSCTLHTFFLAGPGDFSLTMTTITIPAGPIPNLGPDCASVMAIDDTLAEASETFDIVITGTGLPEVSVGTPDTTVVTINDNEGKS